MKGLDTLSKKEIKAFNIPDVMLPCPFCGAEVFVGKHQYKIGAYIVRCSDYGDKCILFPSSGAIDFNEVEEYIKAWNKRF